MYVKPKKNLGQHFLTNMGVSESIANAIDISGTCLEIGPGTGVLTQYLKKNKNLDLHVVEIDQESVEYLMVNFKDMYDENRIIGGDFLKMDMLKMLPELKIICGNFPYNISSQIFFRVLDLKENIEEVVCMIQKEVAVRICNNPGTKEYGILSVFLQAYYDVEYLFEVGPENFNPPPKVDSSVIRLKRNNVKQLDCDEVFFRKIVKESFNLRRKMLRNSLKQYLKGNPKEERFLTLRPEQLSVADFVELTKILS